MKYLYIWLILSRTNSIKLIRKDKILMRSQESGVYSMLKSVLDKITHNDGGNAYFEKC